MTSLKKAKKIITSSNNLVKNSPVLKKFKEKCEVIYFGVNLDYFSTTNSIKMEASSIRKQYSSPLLLSVGRLVYYKGYEYLIDAMKGVNAHLLIIGTGPQEEELNNLIKINNLEKNISIIKPVDDLRPYYEACDIFVFPSTANSEAFGLVQIEAMSFGRPVINTSLPTGVPEVSLDDVSGITVPIRDSRALKDAINKITANGELKNRLGLTARSRIENIFNRENFNKKLLKAILK